MPSHHSGQWAPASKRALGDVWHEVRFGSVARCDRRIRLIVSEAKSGPPSDAYFCKRCALLQPSAEVTTQ